MPPAFGLDIAGYSLGRSGFAQADRAADGFDITVYRGHVFSVPLLSTTPLASHVATERQLLQACVERGTLLVDIPIDLQGLPDRTDVVYAWELVKRPVDIAFNALPALADRIGSPVARFRHLVTPLLQADPALLGQRLFETYPAASLSLLGHPFTRYKSQRVEHVSGAWDGSAKSTQLALIANRLGFRAAEGTWLSDDELDAAVCALTAVVPEPMRLQRTELAAAIRVRVANKTVLPTHVGVPRGYVLLQSLPRDVHVRITTRTVSGHDEMMSVIAG